MRDDVMRLADDYAMATRDRATASEHDDVEYLETVAHQAKARAALVAALQQAEKQNDVALAACRQALMEIANVMAGGYVEGEAVYTIGWAERTARKALAASRPAGGAPDDTKGETT